MSSIFAVPRELYSGDLKPGYECTLYVGHMVGQLRPLKTNANFSEFTFEMHDAIDPTEWILRYSLHEAPAEELARWETAQDMVGIVIAARGQRLFMVAAYNFTRRK